MIYYISTTKQPNLIKTLIEKFGKSSPWSPCYMLCNTQVIYLQGFWYRPDIVCGKNNMHSMDASFWSIADLDELNKLNSKSNCVFLKPETPIEIICNKYIIFKIILLWKKLNVNFVVQQKI